MGEAVSRYAIGVGCRRGCPAATIERLVREVAAEAIPGWNDQPHSEAAGHPPLPCGEGLGVRVAPACGGSMHVDPAWLVKPSPPTPLHKGEGGPTPADAASGQPSTAPFHVGLFTHAAKRDEVGLWAAAAAFGLPLVLLPTADLEAVLDRVATRSPKVLQAVGVPAVAEAAALAGAGPGGRLVRARQARDGATCAIAWAPGDAP